MALPGWLARFNRHATNRLTGTFAGWLPGFAVVAHTGRRSGRQYRTPVNVFHAGDVYVIALTYGAQSEWVKNVIAAGACVIETRGKRVRLVAPRVVTDDSRQPVPAPVSVMLRLMGVHEFLEMTPAEAN